MAHIMVTFEGYGEMIDFARMVAAGGEAVKRPDEKSADKEQPYGRQIAKDFPDANTAAEDSHTEAAGAAEPEEGSQAEAYTLIDVRTALAKLNKEGKKAQVQELIKSFGADKLSQIPEDKYAEVMRKAGEL